MLVSIRMREAAELSNSLPLLPKLIFLGKQTKGSLALKAIDRAVTPVYKGQSRIAVSILQCTLPFPPLRMNKGQQEG